MGNQGWGIFISGSNNIVGGTTAGARNVIAGSVNTGFGGVGIFSGSTDNQIVGNYIGTNKNGTAALGNYYGVRVEGTANLVGGTSSGAQNVISGNANMGVSIINVGNQVLGNLIATTISSIDALPNGSNGISIAGGSATVGGVEAGAGNVIAFNNGSGVAVTSGTGSSIRGNSIFSNTGLGIDLGSTASPSTTRATGTADRTVSRTSRCSHRRSRTAVPQRSRGHSTGPEHRVFDRVLPQRQLRRFGQR